MPATREDLSVLSVSAFARQARLLLEERFNLVYVEGEISNLRIPSSGHWYFTLKDDSAQVRCAMFAGRNRLVRFSPRDGAQVLIRGRVTLYEARGDFQIIAEHIEPAGEGALRAAFEALKEQLAREGLFDAERKRALPACPSHIAVISSPSGAALQDVLHVIERRFPGLAVTLLPVAVQGEAAGPQIIAALDRIATLPSLPDAVLITRGGGSLEDLWAFNLEAVARAVARCPVPTVAAIGHQTDISIVDFVADVRAPTPSAGAELLTPDRQELNQRFVQSESRLNRALIRELRLRAALLERIRTALVDPRRNLQRQMQRADELEERLRLALDNRLYRSRDELGAVARALRLLHPRSLVQTARGRLTQTSTRLHGAMGALLTTASGHLGSTARTLQAVSPLATLNRGYAVLTTPPGPELGAAITSVTQVEPEQLVRAHLRDGSLVLTVKDKDNDARLPQLPPLD